MNTSRQDSAGGANTTVGPSDTEIARNTGALRRLRAARRRMGLRRLLHERQLNPTGLARLIGAPTANAFYNLLKGRTEALPLETIELILTAFPELTFWELAGRVPSSGGASAPDRRIVLGVRAVAGPWSQEPEIPQARQEFVVVPAGPAGDLRDGFVVRTEDVSADRLYPVGSLLVCRPVPEDTAGLSAGSRLVVRQAWRGHFQTLVREMTRENGGIGLTVRAAGTTPRIVAHVRTDPSLRDIPPRTVARDMAILGIVVASWQPERGNNTN